MTVADEPVRTHLRGDVALVRPAHPPVNALATPVRAGIIEAIDRAVLDGRAHAIVLAGSGRCFCGGADIGEFGSPQLEPTAPEVFERIEGCPKPVIAAIHGVALGGGFELALACHYRAGTPSARIGLTEVKLGLIPGAGGTQRLPRLIGAAPALDMILSAEPVSATEARRLGILDRLIEGDLVTDAIAYARDLVADGAPLRRARGLEAGLPSDEDGARIFQRARARLERTARGEIAPLLALESIENAVRLRFEEGLRRERELFMRCRGSEQSAARCHLFFAERAAARVAGVARDTAAVAVRSAAVIGLGSIGRGIAICFASAGIPVSVVEASADALERGLDAVRAAYRCDVAKGRITDAALEDRMSRLAGGTDIAAAAADVVVEAVFEDMALKSDVFRALDRVCRPDAVLATNTSSLDVNALAAASRHPERVMGTHFFSPAHVMRLMENVRGDVTAPETIATVMALSKTLGKVGVLVGVSDGFVGNRMDHVYQREAGRVLEDGGLPEQVDRVLYEFGFAMGPFAVADLAGLDIGWRIRRRRAEEGRADPHASPIADRLCEMGRFGQKTGAGWYRYEEGSRTSLPDPDVERLIVRVAEERGIERRSIDDGEIVERCLYAMVNEGTRILEEGIAASAGDIDVIWVHGYGFPAWRGGPMYHADRTGLATVAAALDRLAERHGERFVPAPLLARLAAPGRRFADT